MVKNDFREDIRELREIENLSTNVVGRRMGVDRQEIRKISIQRIIPERYIKLCEAIGYDIEVIYHRRDDADSWEG